MASSMRGGRGGPKRIHFRTTYDDRSVRSVRKIRLGEDGFDRAELAINESITSD